MGRYIDTVRLRGATGGEGYYYRLPAVKALGERPLKFSRDVTFFVGENGSGKSTLLEAIAVASGFNPEGGSRNFRFSTRNTHAGLWEHVVLSRRA